MMAETVITKVEQHKAWRWVAAASLILGGILVGKAIYDSNQANKAERKRDDADKERAAAKETEEKVTEAVEDATSIDGKIATRARRFLGLKRRRKGNGATQKHVIDCGGGKGISCSSHFKNSCDEKGGTVVALSGCSECGCMKEGKIIMRSGATKPSGMNFAGEYKDIWTG